VTGRSGRLLWILSTVVVVIGLAIVVALAAGSARKQHETLAPAGVVKQVTTVPASVFHQVGVGTAAGAPSVITAPALTAGGKPHIIYVGAEYCPYCAAQRWPMVVALSRFGTFAKLRSTHSSGADVYPNTPTFSFHGSTYTSRWIAFTGVEIQSNKRKGDTYAPLDKLTAAEEQIFTTYNAPPYTKSAGGIPFVDFGGKFIIEGATYDPSVLSGKSTEQIATALSDPTTAISTGVIGVANTFTAAICSLTHNQPASVCAEPVIAQIEAGLK
jgi:hypothetical protein